MAIKTFISGASEAGVSNTKLRVEQIKSEDGFTSLAADLFAVRSQIASIIGTPDYKEDIDGYDVQLAELNPHLSGSYTGDLLKVKQKLEVTLAAAMKSTLEVDAQATLASANVEDLTSGRVVTAGTNGELQDSANLTFDGTDLTMASAKVSDLTDGRVVYAGASGALVDSSEMTFGAAGLTLAKDLSARSGSFSGDVTIVGDLLVQGNTVTVDVGTLLIEDKNVVIAKGGTGASIDGAGIFLGSEAGESIQWNHAGTMWVASDRLKADEFLGDNLTASRLAYSDADKVIQSVSALSSWVAGTANQITVTDDGGVGTPDGTITLSLPQSIHTDADVEFDSLKLGDNVADAGKALKIGAAGEVVAAAWDEFVAIEANVGLELIQSGFKAEIGLAQDIRTTASPEFAALNLGAYGDLLADGSDLKILANAALLFEDSYRAGSTFSKALALAGSSAEWSAIETAYGAEKSLLAMLAAAAPASNMRLVKVQGIASAGSDFFIGAGDAGGAFPTGAASYQNGKSDVYVNGQKQVEGNTKDFEFMDVPGGPEKVKVNFKYTLQIGDVVELVRYPSAAK